MMRVNEDTKYAKVRNLLCDAQVEMTGLSPQEAAFVAQDLQQFVREALDDAIGELNRRERDRRKGTGQAPGQNPPFEQARAILRLQSDRAAHEEGFLRKLNDRVLAPIWWSGLEVWSDEKI